MPIRLTITDDHPLVVSGLQNILRTCQQVEVISTFTSGEELLEGLKKEQPEVLLLDLQMPGKAGPELVSIIKKSYPAIRILILTGQEASYYAQDMLQHGCLGYLLKSTTDQRILINAIEEVYQGKIFVEASIKEELLYDMLKLKKQTDNITDNITRREKEILQFIVAGYKSQEIAEKLFLSIRTIDSHRLSLLQKLNVKNTAGLIKIAMQLKLVD
jgi:DNA-binding NarL/FixJ family response regulator